MGKTNENIFEWENIFIGILRETCTQCQEWDNDVSDNEKYHLDERPADTAAVRCLPGQLPRKWIVCMLPCSCEDT